MKFAILALALTVWPAPGGSLPRTTPLITIYTSFQHDVAEPVEQAMQAEVASIMKPAGFDVEWRSLNGANDSRVAAEIVVVTFRGSCDTQSQSLFQPESKGLGWTHLSDGEILPFAEVDCDRMLALVQGSLFRLPSAERPGAFGRAMARVTAHELYHILARTMHHGSAVSKPSYSSQELLAHELLFDAREMKALHNPAKPVFRNKPQPGSPSETATQ